MTANTYTEGSKVLVDPAAIPESSPKVRDWAAEGKPLCVTGFFPGREKIEVSLEGFGVDDTEFMVDIGAVQPFVEAAE
ncbi:MAG: hypothetical protein AAFR84_01280 [Pseudomonadota bacterium]